MTIYCSIIGLQWKIIYVPFRSTAHKPHRVFTRCHKALISGTMNRYAFKVVSTLHLDTSSVFLTTPRSHVYCTSQMTFGDVGFSRVLQALFLLLQCAHNVDEALRRRKMQSVPPTGIYTAMYSQDKHELRCLSSSFPYNSISTKTAKISNGVKSWLIC